MKIAVIGTGNVGGTLGRVWASRGRAVVFGTRSPGDEKTRALLESTGGVATAATPAEATALADVVVVATPWNATRSALEGLGSLQGKIVVDCTNPLKADLSGLDVGPDGSGGEQVAGWAPGARVVKAFNTVGANIMADPVLDGRATVMFVAGDDAEAKQVVKDLAKDVGFEPIDAGPLAQSSLLESWAMLWIWLAFRGGAGRDFGFARVTR